jgi:hypothetical protein
MMLNTMAIRTAILVVGLLAVVASAKAEATEQAGEPKCGRVGGDTRVRAIVNGKPILDEDVRAEYFRRLAVSGLLSRSQDKQTYKRLWEESLECLIDRTVILFEAEHTLKERPSAQIKLLEYADKDCRRILIKIRDTLEPDQTLEEMLAARELTVDLLCRQIKDDFVASEYMRHLSMGGWEKYARQYYRDHPDEFTVDGIKKPLDEKTESEIAARLERNERERILHDLRQKSTIKRLSASDR